MKNKILPLFIYYVLQMVSTGAYAQGGSLPLNSNVNGNLTSTSTADVWDVTTTSDGFLRFTFTTVSPADLYVSLYDNDGTTLVAGPLESYNNSTVTLNADGLSAGNYHVKITPYTASTFGSYTLADSFFVSPLANDAEPNGSPATALVLPQNSSTTGHVGNYYNTVRDTADWYKVTTSADGLLRISLSTERTAATSVNALDVNLTLYDNDGTTQLGAIEVFSANGPATGVITADGLAKGTYYLKVQPYATSEFADYTISDSLFVPALAIDAEPNGTRATAVLLPTNDSKTGQVGYSYNGQRDTADWYKITTATDGLLRVNLTTARGSVYSTNQLDVNVTLYDNDGTTPLGAVEVYNAGGPATNLISADGLAPGTYYVKVQPYTTTQFAAYTLSDSLFTPTLAIDSEANGSRATAVTLPVDSSRTGHVGYSYNNLRDTADWYKITTTADGLLRVYLTTARGSVYSSNPLDVNVTLYDNDGTTPLGAVEVFNGNNPATGMITADGLAPGIYYVKVQPYATSQFADYTISDSLFVPALAIDSEANGLRATAVALPVDSSRTGHVGYSYNNLRDTADWYKITTTADGLLRVYLTSARGSVYSSNALDVNVTLYDNDGTTLGAVEVFNGNNPASGLITADGLAPGTYYVKVQPYATSQFADYTLSDSLFLTPVANDTEPNGTSATASVFALNSSTTGHAGYYYNNQRDTTDWYQLTTTAEGPLHVYLSSYRGSVYSTNNLDMILTFYASDGTTQLGSKEIFNSNEPATDSLTFTTLAADTYYIKVTTYAVNQFANYRLSNSVAGGIILPVNFISFTGRLADNKALLNWSTATEINNKGFEVEKSMDGQLFTDIGFVPGTGNSAGVNTYQFTDTKIVSGATYYRLKQTNVDGSFTYSPTIRLDFSQFQWTVFGNPVTSHTRIELQLDRKVKVAIQVLATDGKLIETIDKGTLFQGTYSIPLTLLNAPPGVYIVSLLLDNQWYSKTVIK